MLVLTFKNRTLMGLDRLIRDANRHQYGIIREIEITNKDLFCLITELEAPEMIDYRADVRSRFKVESSDNTANLFDFFALKFDFVDRWVKREYIVTYKGVRLTLFKENRATLQT